MSEVDSTKLCKFNGCSKKHFGKGYCRSHYEQLREGREITVIRFQRTRNSEPIITYDEVACAVPGLKGNCFTFNKYRSKKGYGSIKYKGKIESVHRYVWERVHGPIPKELEIDHMCRNRGCCNVDHLRVVTHKINSTENVVGICWQIHKAKTHCPVGHPYDEENTYRNRGERFCRSCRRIQQRIKQKGRPCDFLT